MEIWTLKLISTQVVVEVEVGVENEVFILVHIGPSYIVNLSSSCPELRFCPKVRLDVLINFVLIKEKECNFVLIEACACTQRK